jgi:hypothetical protein
LAPWLASVLWVFACAQTPVKPDVTLTEVWADYRELPDQRALAVAGVLRQGRWVSGASGGHATSAAASESALRECEARRRRLLTPSACRLYAVGEEIVWQGP